MATPAELIQEQKIAREKAAMLPSRNNVKRGSKESLQSLERNAGINLQEGDAERGVGSRRNWRDTIREKAGIFAPQIGNIDWSTRTIDDNGLVETNFWDGLNGVSQPELQLEYEESRRGKLDTSNDGQAYERMFDQKPSDAIGRFGSSRLNEGDLRKKTDTEQDRRTNVADAYKKLNSLEVNAAGLDLKSKALAELKANPNVTADQINSALSQLEQYNPVTILARKQKTANVASTTATAKATGDRVDLERDRDANNYGIAKREVGVKEGTLALARDEQKNNLSQQTWENEFATGKLAHEAREAGEDRIFTAAQNDAQRKMTMEINLLGREDTREQRAYDRKRDERQDRQMMIMQMMKGLQNFGSAFAL